MRRTVETDLNRIRQTLRNNATYSQRGGRGRGGGGASQSVLRRSAPKTHFNFVLPTSPRSPQDGGRRRGRPSIAVVKTQSKMINNLQAVHSSEEFAKGRKEVVNRKRIAMLTGFGAREERQMLAFADAIQLKITKEMSDSLRAAVSSDGARTVSTLRAVVHGVPVVTDEWLRACKRANRLVHTLPYEWQQWAELAKVCDLCTPSTPILKELVMKSGGWLTSNASEAVLIVAPTGVYRRREEERGGVRIVDEKYILDCITSNKMIPLPGETEEIDDSLLSED
ncbi:hypothetical protein PFISCL1PPCAC_18051 [Pristionchus fissidentatus]|uniref:BRCT domain-containing protein n=1 Tax=Pristionchus fissidentatus TaxID=1538716 RepID=A0AAV5WAA0_9BILA|nr:hypothetical protein PFISCL1PPCAC_18051 [Pristionchus fissidentatus]